MKYALASILCLLFFTSAAQDSTAKWTNGGLVNLTYSQTRLNNWAGGGNNSLAVNVIGNYFVHYNKDKFSWENQLDFGYGVLKQGDAAYQKSDDRIEFSSKVMQTMDERHSYAALMNFRTQFVEGYDFENNNDLLSDFMAPAYFTFALGINRKQSEFMSIFLSPITLKTTFVHNEALSLIGAYGVEVGEKQRNEIGGFVRIQSIQDMNSKTKFNGRIDFFSNYRKMNNGADVNAEFLIAHQFNKYLGITYGLSILYDKDIEMPTIPGETPNYMQFKNVLGAGLVYTLK